MNWSIARKLPLLVIAQLSVGYVSVRKASRAVADAGGLSTPNSYRKTP